MQANKKTLESKILTIIIPFRLSKARTYIAERILNTCREIKIHPDIEFLFVDSGSDRDDAHSIQLAITDAGLTYLHHESKGKTFAIGSVRDYGVQHAKGQIVTFFDADLIVDESFFQGLLDMISSMEMIKKPEEFFVVPCVYLTEEGSTTIMQLDLWQRRQSMIRHLLHGNKDLVQNLAPCSSVMVVNRHKYLSLGGHRPEFSGHGYEDFEFIHRLLASTGKFSERPANYYRDSKTWNNTIYDGFRAQFALLGREAIFNGLFTFHLWHSRPNEMGYQSQNAKNKFSAIDYFKEYDETGLGPEPLIDIRQGYSGKSLYFGVQHSDHAKCLREIFPFLGEIVCINESIYIQNGDFNKNLFETYIKQNSIERIIFPNPYGNDARLFIYNWTREKHFPFLCYERGALPDSWFFDSKGFNADSASYDQENWNSPLSVTQIEETKEYISSVTNDLNYLENQGDRLTGNGLRHQMRLNGKKILFVPMQRPSDTVIRFFSGSILSFDNFMDEIDRLALLIKPLGWVIVCKKHPLETASPVLENAIYAKENTNFIDLLEMASAVALINSGVGLYAAMMSKPCYIFGDAFYANPLINRSVNSIWAVIDDINQGVHQVAEETVLRFIHYLRCDFYSYGIPHTRSRTERDGSLRTITYKINFYQICLPNQYKIAYHKKSQISITTLGLIFESYRIDLNNKEILKKSIASSVKTLSNSAITDNRINKNLTELLKPSIKIKPRKKSALLKKFINKPYDYFSDSRHQYLRPMRYLFIWKK